MQAYHELLSSILTETVTNSLECTEPLKDVAIVNDGLVLWVLSETSSLFTQYPILETITTSVFIPTACYFFKKGHLWHKSRKQREEIKNAIVADLKQQRNILDDYIDYYFSVYNSIKSDLLSSPNPFPSTFFTSVVYARYSEKDYAPLFNKEKLILLKSIYDRIQDFEQRESFPEVIENYKIVRKSKPTTQSILQHIGFKNSDNYNELLYIQNQYRSIVCSRVQEFRNLLNDINSFLIDLK